MRVLVVDDHEKVRNLAARLLACLGHEVFEASDAREAEAALSQDDHEFDVVLLDICLDGADGAALAHRMQAARAGLHVLFMSGHSADALATRELQGPRRHFLEKPFSLSALRSALDTLVTSDSQ